MATQVFKRLLAEGAKAGVANDRTAKSNLWFQNQAKTYAPVKVSPAKMLTERDETRLVSRTVPGSMYMFSYDPKGKETLPYYDRFPMVFPFRKTKDGFLGLNLHYLGWQYRALLMDTLEENLLTNARYDITTRLRLTYRVLDSTTKYKWFRPCIKQYLYNHVRSRFIYVHPTEWHLALFLPTQIFVGATKEHIWKQSRNSWK